MINNFIYTNENSPGVFRYLVSHSLNFSLTSPDRYKEGSYCSIAKSSNVSCLVDGTDDTAWRNNNETNAFFFIDFGINHFLLKDYVLRKVCHPISQWHIEGSNDYKRWHEVTRAGPMPELTNVSHFHVSSNSFSYRYYKFALINLGVIHLSQIEFYGILNPIIIQTCAYTTRIKTLTSFLFFFLNK